MKATSVLIDRIKKYGTNNNSFLALYPQFKVFADSIAYIDTRRAWIGAAEPFAAPEQQMDLIEAFFAAAEKAGKTALLLPVCESLATAANEVGFKSIMVGSEPTFVLERYPRTGRTWINVVPTAKLLSAKGARIREFRYEEISQEQRAELDRLLFQWMRSRKTSALGFLNKVDPWHLAEQKRFFQVELNGKILAFAAAIPIWAKKGWYLNDLIRRPGSPAGTTELLVLETMRTLRESGAEMVTLGMAPLAGLSSAVLHSAAHSKEYAFLYRTLNFTFEKINWFYNFRSLYQYKLKFEPTYCDPVFMVFKQIKPTTVPCLIEALVPGGLFSATASSITRLFERFSPGHWVQRLLRQTIVVKATPPDWPSLFRRCKLTIGLICINLALYIPTTDGYGYIFPSVEAQWGFSWNMFVTHPMRSLALSPFLHWNVAHLVFNIFTMILFTGALEYLAGTAIAAACYFIPMILANPITSGLLFEGLKHHLASSISLSETDVGASLGIVGCGGALFWFIKYPFKLLIIIFTVSILNVILTHKFMPLNHCAAALLGVVTFRVALRL